MAPALGSRFTNAPQMLGPASLSFSPVIKDWISVASRVEMSQFTKNGFSVDLCVFAVVNEMCGSFRF